MNADAGHDTATCSLCRHAGVSIMGDSIDSALMRNDALRVLSLSLASQGHQDIDAGALLRDIEEGGFTLRLTTHDERIAKNRASDER